MANAKRFCSTKCNICHTNDGAAAREDSRKLFQCKGCNLILYCGREHQQKDWSKHKEFCNSIQQLLKEKNIKHFLNINGSIKNKTKIDLQQAKILTKLYLHFTLKRDLTNNEKELINFPMICKICYESNFDKLKKCSNCMAVSYCCDDHKLKDIKSHGKICNQLKLYYCAFITNLQPLTLKDKYLQNPISSIDAVLILSNNLLDFIGELIDEKYNMATFLQTINSVNEYEIFAMICNYSYVSTILYCLYKMNIIEIENDTLIIHIVGAATEIVFFTETECLLLFICLPKIFNIHIVFIGPELSNLKTYTKDYFMYNSKRHLKLIYAAEKYETFYIKDKTTVTQTTISNRPNLIISFNCGFSEFSQSKEKDIWSPALHYILLNIQNTPIAFTSYTKRECEEDLNVIKTIADEHSCLLFRLICEKIQNPHRDLRPFRNWEDIDDYEEIYYSNNYLNIIIATS